MTPGPGEEFLREVRSFWMPPRGLSLSLCSLRLFLRKSAFPPFLDPAGGEEHPVGSCRLFSRGQSSAEGSRWMWMWMTVDPSEGCKTTSGTWLVAQEPLQSHHTSWPASAGVSHSLFHPGAPPASGEPQVMFGNHQKGDPDLALSSWISCGSGPCVCRMLVQSH